MGHRKLNMICIADEKIKDFARAKAEIQTALSDLLPAKSSFEIQYSSDRVIESTIIENTQPVWDQGSGLSARFDLYY